MAISHLSAAGGGGGWDVHEEAFKEIYIVCNAGRANGNGRKLINRTFENVIGFFFFFSAARILMFVRVFSGLVRVSF